jgi:hypothetical protein
MASSGRTSSHGTLRCVGMTSSSSWTRSGESTVCSVSTRRPHGMRRERNRRLTSDCQISLEHVELCVPQRFRGRHPSLCLEGLAEKGFGGGHVALGAKVDRLTAGIHGARDRGTSIGGGSSRRSHPRATSRRLDVRSDSNASRTRERSAGPSAEWCSARQRPRARPLFRRDLGMRVCTGGTSARTVR